MTPNLHTEAEMAWEMRYHFLRVIWPEITCADMQAEHDRFVRAMRALRRLIRRYRSRVERERLTDKARKAVLQAAWPQYVGEEYKP